MRDMSRRAVLAQGSLDGARILRPETVVMMMVNQIGDLNVHEMRTAAPTNEAPGPNGRSAGSASWAGLLNCYFWLGPAKKVTGALFTQILPFFDDRVVALYGEFERGLYRGLDRI